MFVVDEGQSELRPLALPDDDAESITGIGRKRYARGIVPAWAQAAGVIGRQRDSVQACPSLRGPVGRLCEGFREDRVVVRPNLVDDPILPTKVAALDRHQSVGRFVEVRVNLARNRSGCVFWRVGSRDRIRRGRFGQVSRRFGGRLRRFPAVSGTARLCSLDRRWCRRNPPDGCPASGTLCSRSPGFVRRSARKWHSFRYRRI